MLSAELSKDRGSGTARTAIHHQDGPLCASPSKCTQSFGPVRTTPAVPNVSQAPRMPVQLVRTECQRAKRTSRNRMARRSGNSDRKSRCQADLQTAAVRTQAAGCRFYFHRTARRLRNPRPVLRPDGSVVQEFPRHRRERQPGNRSPTHRQHVSSIRFHWLLSPTDGSRGSLPRLGVRDDKLRNRPSSCLRIWRAAGAIGTGPKYRGCSR